MFLMMVALAMQSPAASVPTPAALRAGLAGRWTGTLGYRDYQTNEMNLLPVATTISAGPDRVTQTRVSRFDEGPRAAPVWITSVGIVDPKTNRVSSASFRSGRVPEVETETMTIAAYAAPTRWTIVYAQTGSDDDKPADIRVTETRNGAALTSVKEVRPVGGATPWLFRNETKLRRVGD